jgi:hypothetical protein
VSKLLPTATLVQTADLSAAPPRTRIERSFELPTGLYVVSALCYFGFLAVLALALMEPQLIIPMGICAVFVTMFFAVPRLWVTMHPDHPAKSLSWSRFRQRGIVTHTGLVRASDAAVQVLILPVLILTWAFVIVVIRALT